MEKYLSEAIKESTFLVDVIKESFESGYLLYNKVGNKYIGFETDSKKRKLLNKEIKKNFYIKKKELEIEILNFLKQIEKRKIKLISVGDPQRIFAGDVVYSCSNGWEITIFNDCNEWDYIDNIKMKNGRVIDYKKLIKLEKVCGYRPSASISWNCYKIPGHCNFKCIKCSQDLPPNTTTETEFFICENCKKYK